jgi:hypothetical protein
MVSLPIKIGERLNLYTPVLNKIKSYAGTEVAARLEPTIKLMQELRDCLSQGGWVLSDMESFEILATASKLYLSMLTSVCNVFVFGKEPQNIDIEFKWADLYTRKWICMSDPLIERSAILYNLGLVYNQMGIFLAHRFGNYDEATNRFFVAAWIFNQLGMETYKYKSGELGVDLTGHNLLICSELMKAQVHYWQHDKLQLKEPNNNSLLAKLAVQISRHYSTAFRYTSVLPAPASPARKESLAILQYNECSFMARAYLWACKDYLAKWSKDGVGIGIALKNASKAMEYLTSFDLSKHPLPLAAMQQYQTLLAECANIGRRIEVENSTKCHEVIPLEASEIDGFVCGLPISIEEELVRLFNGQAILARMSLTEVQTLEEEYKDRARKVIIKAVLITQNVRKIKEKLYKEYNLPSSVYVHTNGQELPQDLWKKIKYCKSSNFMYVMKELKVISSNSMKILKSLKERINKEEEEDKKLKERYKEIKEPTVTPNENIKKQVDTYEEKLMKGISADNNALASIEKNTDIFSLLNLDRAELTKIMPKSNIKKEVCSIANKMNEYLLMIVELENEIEFYGDDLIKCHEAESVVSDMIRIYQGVKDKKKVML